MGYGPKKTWKVVYYSSKDYQERVTFVQATDKNDASFTAQNELRGLFHTIKSITEC